MYLSVFAAFALRLCGARYLVYLMPLRACHFCASLVWREVYLVYLMPLRVCRFCASLVWCEVPGVTYALACLPLLRFACVV